MQDLEIKTGVKNPRLLSRPQLRADCQRYMAGFRALSNSRQFSQVGIMPLQISEIHAYAEITGIEPGQPAEKFLRVMQAMDGTHLEWWSKQQK